MLPDDTFKGAGLHCIEQGGYLNVHVDFNKQGDLNRRINSLLYLNEDWDDSYGGHLELWNKDLSECVKSISPDANT